VPLVQVREAQAILGVSRETMRRLIKRGMFTVYENPRDHRQKLLDTDELARYLEPKVASPRRTEKQE
jgi:transposase